MYEARWKAGPAEERELWQGLAQLCVAITHAERGNQTGALRLLGRAHRRLETYAATGGPAYGLDLGRIVAWSQDRELIPTQLVVDRPAAVKTPGDSANNVGMDLPRVAWRPLALLSGGLAVLLLVVSPRYGPHRDEMYF